MDTEAEVDRCLVGASQAGRMSTYLMKSGEQIKTHPAMYTLTV